MTVATGIQWPENRTVSTTKEFRIVRVLDCGCQISSRAMKNAGIQVYKVGMETDPTKQGKR